MFPIQVLDFIRYLHFGRKVHQDLKLDLRLHTPFKEGQKKK